MPSGVKDMRPLNARASGTSRSAGSRRPASSRAAAKCSGVKARSDGCSAGAGRRDLLGGAQERLVQVGADAVGLADLPQVHRAVLVAQDRIADLALRAAQLGQRLGQGVDVLDRVQREAPARRGA